MPGESCSSCRELSHNNFTGPIPDSISTLSTLQAIYLANNHLSGSLPSAISRLEKLQQIWLDNNSIEGPLPSAICSLPWLWRIGCGACEWLAVAHVSGWLWRIMVSNNHLYGPLPDCLFDKCINQIDVSNNSLYGRINHDFNSMVADWEALINLAHNFFYGDAVLFAAGCRVCPEEITQRNQLQLGDSSVRLARNCSDTAFSGQRDYSVVGAGKGARGSLAGNCLTLKRDVKCPSNATQRSTAACQAFCSITDNGPCDGHGACVPPAPDAQANFTCMYDAEYSSMDLGNSSTCAILSSTTTAGEAPSHMDSLPGSCSPCCAHISPMLRSHLTHAALTSHPCCAHISPMLRSHLTRAALPAFSASPTPSPRLPTFFTPPSLLPPSLLSTGVIVGITVGCFAGFTLLTAVLAWLLWPRRQRKWEGLDLCEQFSLQQLVKATDNWAPENLLGQGGFGTVYKGCSPQGQLWAVKRSTVMTNEFETEVRAMASLHHVNLVRLLGFCQDQNVEKGKQEQILVYEFVGNRDLHHHLYKTKSQMPSHQVTKSPAKCSLAENVKSC
ncbi:unnamed protein product [Closterium sp. NIES-65]|nr:unnamed protein product [Closterium sp. NIES-65]